MFFSKLLKNSLQFGEDAVILPFNVVTDTVTAKITEENNNTEKRAKRMVKSVKNILNVD